MQWRWDTYLLSYLLNNSLLQFLSDVNGKSDIINLAYKYNTTYEHFVKQYKNIVNTTFFYGLSEV